MMSLCLQEAGSGFLETLGEAFLLGFSSHPLCSGLVGHNDLYTLYQKGILL